VSHPLDRKISDEGIVLLGILFMTIIVAALLWVGSGQSL
jgi:hypothetical protein